MRAHACDAGDRSKKLLDVVGKNILSSKQALEAQCGKKWNGRHYVTVWAPAGKAQGKDDAAQIQHHQSGERRSPTTMDEGSGRKPQKA